MAKPDSKLPETAQAAEATAAPSKRRTPRLGELVHVTVAAGASLINNETGALFADGVRTPQTVTLTTLRRLTDGDLVLAD